MSAGESSGQQELVRTARRNVERSGDRLQSMPQDSLDASAARSAVREDITALEAIPKSNPERVFAAETIGRNARTQFNYADELAKPEVTSSAVFLEVQAAVAEMDRRASVR